MIQPLWFCRMATTCAILCLTNIAIAQPETESSADKMKDFMFRLGIGSGVVYGGAGIKGEIRLARGLTAMVGLGYSTMDPSDGTDYGPGINGATDIGLFYYLPLESTILRPRIGVNYGENQWYGFERDVAADPGFLGEQSGRVAANGTSLSAGLVLQTGKAIAIEVDLLYAFRQENITSAIDYSSPWQVAVGIGYTWAKSDGANDSFEDLPR